ncbi:MAG: ABC transporter ATP-binding protein [Lachnospiraceae bacterium]|nr:ABC transporter ATP-binding protein [Lachnospiraceae bacterium]
MEFLKVDNLCKVYGKGENQVTALDHVSLTVDKGEFAAIIGTSGSGKSTLLHSIAGVDIPTGGKIYLDGQDIYAGNNEQLAIFRRRQVGLIYQFHNLIPTLNVVENITLPILMDRRKVNKERLNELLELLGLQERRKHLPNQLSGGQQQRVAIGRALMNAPAVMLADEPTGSLDSRNGQEIIRLLKESNKKYGQTLLLVTHDESIALQAERIITIADGRIVRDRRAGRTEQVLPDKRGIRHDGERQVGQL